jgi:hypothetical protein
MSHWRSVLRPSSILAGLILTIPLAGQQTSTASAPRDAQAITILGQALNSAGGLAALTAINDSTSSGTITFFWAGEQVNGTAVLKRRGIGEFRLDIALPDGARTWIVNNGVGTFTNVDGTVRLDPEASAFGLGFPYAGVLAALADTSVAISYIGLETRAGVSVHHIRLGAVQSDSTALPSGNFGIAKELYIDASTFQIFSVVDQAHLQDNLAVKVPREVRSSNFQTINGIVVASTFSETIYGQPTMTIQLSQISFNSGLTDTDFQQ